MKKWMFLVLVIVLATASVVAAAGRVELSRTWVVENRPGGTLVGYLSAPGMSGCTYSVVEGGGQFQVLRDKLLTKITFDYERQFAYRVRLSAVCGGVPVGPTLYTISILNALD